MNKSYQVNYCIDNPSHPTFRATDGARCVECKSLVSVTEVEYGEYHNTPTYSRLIEERRPKPKSKQSISIAVEADTNKLQLKLRAIAKHAEALANELDAIDNTIDCPNCGSNKVDESIFVKTPGGRVCAECGTTYIVQSELPTHLEGSD